MNQNWLMIALFGLVSAAAGCKQDLGERCQVDADCASGVCSRAIPQVCVADNNQDVPIDATVPIDAIRPCDGASCTDASADAPI